MSVSSASTGKFCVSVEYGGEKHQQTNVFGVRSVTRDRLHLAGSSR